MKKIFLLFIGLFSKQFASCDFILQFNKEEQKFLDFYSQKLVEYPSVRHWVQEYLNEFAVTKNLVYALMRIGGYVESVDDSMSGMIEISAYMKYFYENKIIFQDEEQSLFQQAFNLMKRRLTWYDHFQCSNTVFENCMIQSNHHSAK